MYMDILGHIIIIVIIVIYIYIYVLGIICIRIIIIIIYIYIHILLGLISGNISVHSLLAALRCSCLNVCSRDMQM